MRELCAAVHRVVSQTDTPVDLLSLLPGSPRCPHQRDLSWGVMERRRRVLQCSRFNVHTPFTRTV